MKMTAMLFEQPTNGSRSVIGEKRRITSFAIRFVAASLLVFGASGVALSDNISNNVSNLGITGSGVRNLGITGSGARNLGITGSGARNLGITGSGARNLGITGSGARNLGITGSGARNLGITGSGARNLGITGSGARNLGITGSGVRGSADSGNLGIALPVAVQVAGTVIAVDEALGTASVDGQDVFVGSVGNLSVGMVVVVYGVSSIDGSLVLADDVIVVGGASGDAPSDRY